MTSKSMFKVSADGQEDILVPSRELAERMVMLLNLDSEVPTAIVAEVGRKDANAFVRASTAKVEIPSIWLGLLEEVKAKVHGSSTFAEFTNLEGPTHGAVALCAIVDANRQTVTMTVKRVDGKASDGKRYFDAGGQGFGSLAEYIHLNGGNVNSMYPAQAARQYNRVDGEPKSLKQKEA